MVWRYDGHWTGNFPQNLALIQLAVFEKTGFTYG